jgi:hypothetical protein
MNAHLKNVRHGSRALVSKSNGMLLNFARYNERSAGLSVGSWILYCSTKMVTNQRSGRRK